MGVEQKSWATFALLFGIGFAIQLRQMEKKGLRVTPVYLRRLLGLVLFGIVACLGFGFRILLDYAFWGVPLLFMRRWSIRALLLLSSGYGLALEVRPALVPVLAALIFGLEVLLSRLWLARHRWGPLEWLWRLFTYGVRQPLRTSLA